MVSKRMVSTEYDSVEPVLRCLQMYREEVPSHSLLYFQMFLLVATRSPIAQVSIAEQIGIPEAMVSDGIGSLSNGGRRFPERYGSPPALVERTSHPIDARSKLVGLSPKGYRLVARMEAALKEGRT